MPGPADWCGHVADMRHCSKMQNVMMYPVQLVDVFSDTFRPLVESAINVSTELDEVVAGQAIKGYVHHSTPLSLRAISREVLQAECRGGREHYWCQCLCYLSLK